MPNGGGAPHTPSPQHWAGLLTAGSVGSGATSGASSVADDMLLGCFEASTGPADVRQGLVWTLSVADGLSSREGPPAGHGAP